MFLYSKRWFWRGILVFIYLNHIFLCLIFMANENNKIYIYNQDLLISNIYSNYFNGR